MSSGDFTARVLHWCQRMRHEGDDEIANMLASAEMGKRHKPRANKGKVVDVADRYGAKARKGSKGRANMSNPDIIYIET